MYWNHRVVDMSENDEPFFEIQEVYYNAIDVPCAYCDPCVGGNDLEEIKVQLERFAKCLSDPILKKSDFVGKLTDNDEGEW